MNKKMALFMVVLVSVIQIMFAPVWGLSIVTFDAIGYYLAAVVSFILGAVIPAVVILLTGAVYWEKYEEV